MRDQSRSRLHSQCKQCYKAKRELFYIEHYKKYGDTYRTRARIRKAAIKRLRQEQLIEYLADKSCERCGISDLRVLDFDHIDAASKKFGISRGITACYAWEEIVEEIKKCRILCANCHRIRTAEQQNWRKWHLGRVVRQGSAKP